MGSSLYQFIAVFCGNLGTIVYRISIGWMGVALMLFNSNHSPLPSGRVHFNELGWITSMIGAGGMFGTILAGWLADLCGRKTTMLLTAIPQIIGFLLIIFAQNVYYLMASEFLAGFGGGVFFVVIPLLVTEIAEDSSRGRLGTMLVLQGNVGTLAGTAICHFLNYKVGLWLCLLFPVSFLVFFAFMAETPYYLMKCNKMQDAEKSLRFYRNVSSNDAHAKSFETFERDLAKLRNTHAELHSKTETNSLKKNPKLRIGDFLNRPMAMGCALIAVHEIHGVFVLLSFASVVFTKSGSSLSPGMSAIIAAAIQFVGSYVACLLVDRLGRKLLMVVSLASTAIVQIIFATYMFLKISTDIDVEPYNWLPVVAFSAMIFVASCGAIPVPFVVVSEILPHKIRSVGISICLIVSWVLIFVLIKGFSFFSTIIHMYGCIYIFATFSIAIGTYVFLAVPETKGKSLDEILVLLKSK